MKPGERVAFTWHPVGPVNAFECILVTNRDEVPGRAYAVTVTATDADGERVLPTGGGWFHSDALESHYQYAPASETDGTSRLKPWASDAYPQEFRIAAVAWSSGGPDIPEIVALGISPVHSGLSTPRTWQLLHPDVQDQEVVDA